MTEGNFIFGVILACLLSVSLAAAAGAWLAGPSRIPFVISTNHILPPSFGKLHPRYRTPYIALMAEGLITTFIIIVTFTLLGLNTKESYQTLVDIAVVIQLIPFLYMFAALIKVRRRKEPLGNTPFFKSSWLCFAAGVIGFAATAIGLALVFIPPEGEQILLHELKIVGLCVICLTPAVFLYLKEG